MQQWLNDSTILERLKLPTSFGLDTLEPYVTEAVEENLVDLLTPAQYQSLNDWLLLNPNGVASEMAVVDPFNEGLYKLVGKFLVYTAYAEYIQRGDVTPTETGLTQRYRPDETGISEERRAALYRTYRDKAARWAIQIKEYLNKDTCAPVAGGFNVRITKAVGRYDSFL